MKRLTGKAGHSAVRWQVKLKDGIESTAAITKDTIYVGCFDGHLYAFDLKTGAAKELLRESYADATLYVIEDNPRARRFYEREGWAADGTTKTGEFLGLTVAEIRYRIKLA